MSSIVPIEVLPATTVSGERANEDTSGVMTRVLLAEKALREAVMTEKTAVELILVEIVKFPTV